MKYNIIFFLLLTIPLNAQNKNIQTKDSLYKAIKLYREVFWNDLPKPSGYINDYENLYNDTEESILSGIITEFEKETSVEIAFVTIDTVKTSKEKFEDLSLHIAKEWGIGKKGKDNGILIAISKGYRRIRIQTGSGMEKVMTDEETEKIIYDYLIPEFRKDEYYEGSLNGLLEIIKLLKSKTEK